MRTTAIALLLALAFFAAAQPVVPVTRWHDDASVRMPGGAYQVLGEQCRGAATVIGRADRADDLVCYTWMSDPGNLVYGSLMLAFEAAGYEIGAEGVLPTPAVGTLTVVFHAQREAHHALYTLYHDGGMVVLFTLVEE